MRTLLLSATLALILLILSGSDTQAKPQVDHPLLAAKAASEASNLPRLLQAQRHLAGDPLKVWADYWVMRLMVMQDPFGPGTPSRVAQFVGAAGVHPTAKLILKDWGQSALQRGSWEQVVSVIDQLKPTSDSPSIACALARVQIERGQLAPAQAAEQIRGHESRKGCLFLMEAIHLRQPLSIQALQTHARWAAASGDLEAASRIWRFAEGASNRLEAELPLLSLLARARSKSILSARQLDGAKIRLNDSQRAFAQGILAGRLFVHSDPRAWTYLQEALNLDPRLLSQMPPSTLEALARLALRKGDWARLQEVLSSLPAPLRSEDQWVYWRAWLAQRRGEREEARSLWSSISPGWGFYQQLASAAIQRPGPSGRRDASLNPETARAGEQLRAQGGLDRALSLAALGLRAESSLEWRAILDQQPDSAILAAAELAFAAGHYDRAIQAAMRTQSLHDLGLRYPKPYKKTIDHYAAARSLDTNWVYGLIRQESRFLSGARSPVGAAGLMQIMPKTARSLAKVEGIRNFRPSTVTEPDLNVRLGTRYLRTLLDDFKGSWVLATAAYNAGPARSRLWRSSLVQEIPGAAFAESIPFAETRDYVKIVLANAAAYQSPATPNSLTAWVGPIGPGSAPGSENPSLKSKP